MAHTALLVVDMFNTYRHADADLRHYAVTVPHDAVAHIDAEPGAAALTMMQRNMSAEIVAAAKCLD